MSSTATAPVLRFANKPRLIQEDYARLANVYKGLQNEEVIALCVVPFNRGKLRVVGVFHCKEPLVTHSDSEHVGFRSDFVISAMDYCASRGLGLLLVHNHPFGHTPSPPDEEAEERMGAYARACNLPLFIFAVYGMRDGEVLYRAHHNDGPTFEYLHANAIEKSARWKTT